MQPEAARLRAQLAEHFDDLWRLQVVEAAEEIVRRQHLQLLNGELAELRDQLTRAQQRLGLARDGNELTLIIQAEEHLCSVLRRTTIMQRHADAHMRAAKRAHETYVARRDWLIDRIEQLRRLVS